MKFKLTPYTLTVTGAESSRGRYFIYVRRPGGKKFSCLTAKATRDTYFEQGSRSQEEAFQNAERRLLEKATEGYDVFLTLQYWEAL